MLYRIDFRAHKGTLSIVNTLHLVLKEDEAWQDGPQADPTAQDVAEEVDAHLGDRYLSLLAQSYTFDEIVATSVPDPNSPQQVPSAGSAPRNESGARVVGDEDLPPRIGGLLAWRTGLVGRNFRGRFFGPPVEKRVALSQDLIASGDDYSVQMNLFGAAVRDAHYGLASTWSSAWIDTWHGRFVVYSRTRHKQGLEPFYADINGYGYSRRLAYLSSRDK